MKNLPEARSTKPSSTCRRCTAQSAARDLRCRAAVGIDLGTTSSVVCIIQDNVPTLLSDARGEVSLPSVVHYGEQGVTVGPAALQLYDARNTFHSIKRLMGMKYADVADLTTMLPYTVEAGDTGNAVLRCTGASSLLTPPEVSAEVLKVLKRRAEEHTGEAVDRAVITVPARFGPEQRLATMEAGMRAGIARVSLLQEPVAAALANTREQMDAEEEAILVFDLGGGTFDVSLLQCFDGCLELSASSGNAHLGGLDMDRAIAMWLLERCGLPVDMALGATAKLEKSLLAQLLQAAEVCKIKLSTQDAVTVQLPFLDGWALKQAVHVTRQQMAVIVEPFLAQLQLPIQRLADEYKLALQLSSVEGEKIPPARVADRYTPCCREVTRLVLAGGATRSPLIRMYAERIAGVSATTLVDPEHSVAVGAAIQAGLMEGSVQGALEMTDSIFSEPLHGRTSGFQM